ncbi:ferredoxin family protein, partial [Mesorhizobium sp. M8A.F.Ca.ET.197.01.1.1]
MTIAVTKLRVEEKLYQNRYLVDPGRPHIKVQPHERPSANLLALTHICPAKCYELNDKGQVETTSDGCMECGT